MYNLSFEREMKPIRKGKAKEEIVSCSYEFVYGYRIKVCNSRQIWLWAS